MIARLRISGEMPRGMIFVPIHWNSAFSSDARVGALVNPIVDPISGEPELKHTPARVTPFVVSWHGFMLTREPTRRTWTSTWWTLARGDAVPALRDRRTPRARRLVAWARTLFNAQADDADWLEYSDPERRRLSRVRC